MWVDSHETNRLRGTYERQLVETKNDQILGLQYLRAAAAIAVVASHAAQIIPIYGRGDFSGSFHMGAAGVDAFFVISGFIMCHITDNENRNGLQFFKRRLARVAPAYWIVTSMIALVMLIHPATFRTSEFSPELYLASMTFLAWPNAATGDAQPLLLIGWTLNYEFFFYSLFAVMMSINSRHKIILVAISFIILGIFGTTQNISDPMLAFYTNPISLEFVAGMLIWKFYKSGLINGKFLGCTLTVCAVLILVVIDNFIWVERSSVSRVLYWGLPGALLVAGTLCLEASGAIKRSRFLYALGDASYSIYLSHIITLGIVRAFWGKFDLKQWLPDAILLIVGVVASIVIGYLFHLFVEKPASAKMRSIVFARSQPR